MWKQYGDAEWRFEVDGGTHASVFRRTTGDYSWFSNGKSGSSSTLWLAKCAALKRVFIGGRNAQG